MKCIEMNCEAVITQDGGLIFYGRELVVIYFSENTAVEDMTEKHCVNFYGIFHILQ